VRAGWSKNKALKMGHCTSMVYTVKVFCFNYYYPKDGVLRKHTDKKENKIFLIYKEIQNGTVANSYMTNGLLVYGEIFAHFLIY
jgi:hypothetical protein